MDVSASIRLSSFAAIHTASYIRALLRGFERFDVNLQISEVALEWIKTVHPEHLNCLGRGLHEHLYGCYRIVSLWTDMIAVSLPDSIQE